MATLLLTQSEVRSLLSMEAAVAAVEEAFAAHGRRETVMPPKVYLEVEKHRGDFRAMPSLYGGSAGLKWVNAHPDNPRRHGLPTVRGLYILSDPATAEPLAVMDATWLTAVRTGAAAAVAARYLARSSSRTVGLVGTGAQASTILEALRVVFENLEIVAADREATRAEHFATEAGGRAGSVDEASSCDIVCTATPATRPIVARRWIRSGTHINAMGADGPGKQELDPRILRDGLVVVDDHRQAEGSGEINVPLRRGQIERQEIHASLGEVVAGLRSGRSNDDQITIFDSTGLAIQDLAVARLIFESASEREVGRMVDFFL